MKILAIGTNIRTGELKQKFSSNAIDLVCADEHTTLVAKDENYDVIFDLGADDSKHDCLLAYEELRTTPVFLSAAKRSLAQMVRQHEKKINYPLFGINALPGFINRSLAEVSVYNEADKNILEKTLGKLNWSYKLVNDRVGMLTPRVIFMIINEACYTLQEGTAAMKDIDTSMKLGTNYPYGPFEWADKIGIEDVYETLEAIYQDTHDERYKICPLMKTAYLKGENFYK